MLIWLVMVKFYVVLLVMEESQEKALFMRLG